MSCHWLMLTFSAKAWSRMKWKQDHLHFSEVDCSGSNMVMVAPACTFSPLSGRSCVIIQKSMFRVAQDVHPMGCKAIMQHQRHEAVLQWDWRCKRPLQWGAKAWSQLRLIWVRNSNIREDATLSWTYIYIVGINRGCVCICNLIWYNHTYK